MQFFLFLPLLGVKVKSIFKLFCLLSMVGASSVAMANEYKCLASVDGQIVFDGPVELDHWENEPEGAGSKVFYYGEGYQFYVESYPAKVRLHLTNLDGEIQESIENSAGVAIYQFVQSKGGRSSRLEHTTGVDSPVGRHRFDISCSAL